MNRDIIHVDDERILAKFNEQTIRVYQAFRHQIADEVVKLGTFGASFSLSRMTWIKPSFLWMMYRSGWATKEGQERILAVDMKRYGFDTILENDVLSAYNEKIYGSYENWKQRLDNSDVRCQLDPDRDIYGNPVNRRAIQIGIKGEMVNHYISEWIEKITDITEDVIRIRESIRDGKFENSMLPVEGDYPIDIHLFKLT